jgi:hypothetical protein
MFTRKHFVQLAKAIASVENASDRSKLADTIGAVCRESNPRFDSAKWLKACAVKLD